MGGAHDRQSRLQGRVDCEAHLESRLQRNLGSHLAQNLLLLLLLFWATLGSLRVSAHWDRGSMLGTWGVQRSSLCEERFDTSEHL